MRRGARGVREHPGPSLSRGMLWLGMDGQRLTKRSATRRYPFLHHPSTGSWFSLAYEGANLYGLTLLIQARPHLEVLWWRGPFVSLPRLRVGYVEAFPFPITHRPIVECHCRQPPMHTPKPASPGAVSMRLTHSPVKRVDSIIATNAQYPEMQPCVSRTLTLAQICEVCESRRTASLACLHKRYDEEHAQYAAQLGTAPPPSVGKTGNNAGRSPLCQSRRAGRKRGCPGLLLTTCGDRGVAVSAASGAGPRTRYSSGPMPSSSPHNEPRDDPPYELIYRSRAVDPHGLSAR